MAILAALLSNKFFQKAFVLLCGIAVVSLFIYARKIKIVNNSQHAKETDDDLQRNGTKIFIAFNYWEQLTAATNNFLDITALAAYGGRHVVVSFVKNSLFYGSPTKKSFQTLALYYNVTALNGTLRSRGHGTLISWKEFQGICQGTLDVLVHLDYKRNSQATPPIFSCKDHQRNTFGDFNVRRTICMNVFAVDSVEKFENNVVKRLPCVCLAQWREIDNKYHTERSLICHQL